MTGVRAAYTWEQLGRLSLARQFPLASGNVSGTGLEQAVETLRAVGPIQTQTARSAFVGLAARLPGMTRETLTAAYQDHAIVRGSTLRGTVHTCVAGQHPVLEAATRIGQRTLWQRAFKPRQVRLEQVWSGIEEFAWQHWRTPPELSGHLASWLAQHDPHPATDVDAAPVGRYLGFGHGGLVRRPLRGGWEGQAAPGYRTARAVLGDGPQRDALFVDAGAALTALVSLHLSRHGPASRHDIAWWSGVGLRAVDGALQAMGEAVTARPGPDGREYWDVVSAVPDGVADVGTRLLPEFDALLCGYEPAARARFVSPEHHAQLWDRSNGLLRAPVLHAGRITGHWRAEGSGRRRVVTVWVFEGCPEPNQDERAAAAADVAAAMGWDVTDLRISTAVSGS